MPAPARSARRWAVPLFLALVILPGAGPATAATATATTDEPTAGEASRTPEVVAEWFVTDGPRAALDEGAAGAVEDPEKLSIGLPHRVSSWAEDYLAGDQGVDATDPRDEWVAPVHRTSAGSPAPLGTLRAGLDDDVVTPAGADDDDELAEVLSGLESGLHTVYDADVQGWFAVSDSKVWPLTQGAREVLNGGVSLSTWQPFVAERLAGSEATALPDEPPPSRGSATLVAIAVVLIAGAIAVGGVVLHLRRGDRRLASDAIGAPAATVSED